MLFLFDMLLKWVKKFFRSNSFVVLGGDYPFRIHAIFSVNLHFLPHDKQGKKFYKMKDSK